MFGRAPANWWRRRGPKRDAVCHRTKTATLNAFRDANILAIENWGGLDRRESPIEFEAVNHKYGTKAKTLAEAFWAALPVKKPPYCLDDIDLEALNDTDPGRMVGGFRLPDWIYERRAAAEQEAYYRQQYGLEGTTMARRRRRRGPMTSQQRKFKRCATQCVGGGRYKGCMRRCLRTGSLKGSRRRY